MARETETGVQDRPRPVREGEELDAGRLGAFLAERFPAEGGPLEVRQFPKGHSNLTYCLRYGAREMVLRRPPFGANIATAHDMSREFRVLSGLSDTYPLAPRPLAYCEDEAVLGAPFFLMERVRGVILRGNEPPAALGLGEAEMGALSKNLVDGLAALHAVDASKEPLAALGRPQGYVERQVTGWTRRYFAARTDEIPAIEAAARWLGEHTPPERGTALIHGDFKYDNLVLDPNEPTRVVAVLDWEMATVGDPWMDLGTSLGYWLDPEDPDNTRSLPFGLTLREGNLRRAELVERYARRTGGDAPDPLFYYVYGLFKVAVIAQQIYRRYKLGHTLDPRFAMMILGVHVLGEQAARAIERGRIHDLG